MGFYRIIVVNDGSHKEYDEIFRQMSLYPQCIILKHAVNLGKGRALKTGFNYYLNNYAASYNGIISVDSDGQHSIKNVIDIDIKLSSIFEKEILILGCRDFSSVGIPFKSRFGNILTSVLFRLLYSTKIGDTQTGLRGFSNATVMKFMSLYGERFEFETNMLIYAKRMMIPIMQVPIETIYINDNKGTHFKPILDSIKIYTLLFSEFVRFALVLLSSFVIDISLFYIFTLILSDKNLKIQIFAATAGARAISSMFNCIMNKKVVFYSVLPNTLIIPKYYLLCVIQASCSALLLYLCASAIDYISPIFFKIVMDILLFILSFHIQKAFVYVQNERH